MEYLMLCVSGVLIGSIFLEERLMEKIVNILLAAALIQSNFSVFTNNGIVIPLSALFFGCLLVFVAFIVNKLRKSQKKDTP